jgi:hypothetical protein
VVQHAAHQYNRTLVCSPCSFAPSDATQRLADEVRSVNSSPSKVASEISAIQLSLARQLLRIVATPFDQTDPALVLHGEAGGADYGW